jgi:hypothetical protein
MSQLPPSETPSAAEQRLLALLLLLRSPAEGGDPSLIGSVMSKVRVQKALRELLGVLGGVTGAVEDVLRLFAARTRGERS